VCLSAPPQEGPASLRTPALVESGGLQRRGGDTSRAGLHEAGSQAVGRSRNWCPLPHHCPSPPPGVCFLGTASFQHCVPFVPSLTSPLSAGIS
jgi:hypothetical protein